jgi:hypothetical protein
MIRRRSFGRASIIFLWRKEKVKNRQSATFASPPIDLYVRGSQVLQDLMFPVLFCLLRHHYTGVNATEVDSKSG